ncbi:NagB/RpiA/CoA transferase-like superfamily protein [Actinidia rufa]|uniref:NagB/RpiA/CoA transferase-like superfamily protein n=1 Tax=Actinidia rufa TaxID=165716 RepID=A0A7J0H4C3_9ERIC|nr:NagB/RpiA/CoA transferase-like superfamily protein [Actinidia rufa]
MLPNTGTVRAKATITSEMSLFNKLGGVIVLEFGRGATTDGDLNGCHGTEDVPPVGPSIAASEKKGGDRPPEKDRKKDALPPRMRFDDTNRVEKAKRRAVVNKTEARNRVELFRHLPQYEHGTQLPDLEAKFFQLDPMHPAVYKVTFPTE